MIKRCIIIDNEDQSEIIEKLVRDAKLKGVDIDCVQFNVGSTFLTEVLTENRIDIPKVVSEYKRRFGGQSFQLAAFDWDLSDDKIDGVELMRQLTANKIFRATPKLLYSGLLEEKLSDKIDDLVANKITKTELLNRIKTLIKADIKDFVSRENYDSDIIRILLTSDETLDLIIEEELSKYPNFIFKNKFINKNFNGKSFSEIAHILEEHDHFRNGFKKEIIQQVMAYLTEKI